MTDTDEPTRCPRGHLTPSAFEYCTTCGERLTPGTEPEDVGGPPPPPDDRAGAGSAVRARLDAFRRKRGEIDRGAATAALPSSPPPVLEPPRPIEEPTRRFGGLRRKPRQAKPPGAEPGLSLLPEDLKTLPNEPPRVPPPEVEPARFGEAVGTSSYPDVEFAIAPGTRSVVAVDRPAAAEETQKAARRGPEIPTRVLLVILLIIVLIAAAIIFFIAREPGTPVATLIPPSAAATQASATPAATATSVAPSVVVSEECGNAFAFAAAHAAEAQAPAFQQRTLELCTTSDEWVAAARLHPTAIGESSASGVDVSDLARVCTGAPTAPLCRSKEGTSAPTPPTASP